MIEAGASVTTIMEWDVERARKVTSIFCCRTGWLLVPFTE